MLLDDFVLLLLFSQTLLFLLLLLGGDMLVLLIEGHWVLRLLFHWLSVLAVLGGLVELSVIAQVFIHIDVDNTLLTVVDSTSGHSEARVLCPLAGEKRHQDGGSCHYELHYYYNHRPLFR